MISGARDQEGVKSAIISQSHLRALPGPTVYGQSCLSFLQWVMTISFWY